MMTLNKPLLAILLLTGGVRAQTVGDDGLPVGGRLDVTVTMSGAAPDTDKAFVGHYGLAFTFKKWLTARARMEGLVEVIEIFPSRRDAPMTDPGYGGIVLPQPFNPKPEDWRPENFTKLELVQVVIAPLSLSKYATLEDLIKDKKASMDAQGLKYRTHIQTDDFVNSALKPIGTHTVVIDAPYCLHQVYYRTKSLSFIVSSGCGNSEFSTAENIQRAITDIVSAENRLAPLHPTKLHALWRDPERVLSIWLQPKSFLLYAPLILSFALLPFHFLGKYARRLFSAGAHGASVGFAAMLGGWFLGYLATLANSSGWDASTITLLILLSATTLMSRTARARHGASWLDITLRIVLPAAPIAIIVYYGIGNSRMTTEEAQIIAPSATATVAGVFCAVPALIWGLLSKAPGAPWRKIATALFFFMVAAPASAQPIPAERLSPHPWELESAASEARRILAARNITASSEKDDLRKAGRARGEIYDYQRVEVTGMWSADDTNNPKSALFDKQIKPSFLNEESLEVISKPSAA